MTQPTEREPVNTIAPALRALLAEGEALRVVRFEAGAAAGPADVAFRPPAEAAPRAIVGALASAVRAAERPVAAVAVEGLGRFVVADDLPPREGRSAGKVAVVTGAAQGIGLEIAKAFVAEGAIAALADVNEAGAAAEAEALCEAHGPGRALALPVDVTDEESVRDAVDRVVRAYGGFDVFVSNAGVLKAGSVKTQPPDDFRFVTGVNYVGYFIFVQHAAPVLAVQHLARPAYLGDIIQINSKSGLAGSNRNAAYAGSKFGGLGLTQSFALELIADGIKVNAICPGNFFDGPLWSDPDNGLFVQYLRTNKVPGAESVEDVRRAYEAKVPMGRGCTPADLMAAIYYVMEQKYETGQAVPVTGGQVMLR
jgi:sorbitol-6-phosphate 2-dehydrogenase